MYHKVEKDKKDRIIPTTLYVIDAHYDNNEGYRLYTSIEPQQHGYDFYVTIDNEDYKVITDTESANPRDPHALEIIYAIAYDVTLKFVESYESFYILQDVKRPHHYYLNNSDGLYATMRYTTVKEFKEVYRDGKEIKQVYFNNYLRRQKNV